MIFDERTELCDAVSVALTAGSAAQNIGDVIDLSVARDIGNGEPLYLVIQVDTGINAAGAGSIQFSLVSDSVTTPATDGSQTVHASSRAFVTSTTSGNAGGALAAGTTLFVIALPMEGAAYERYLGLQATVLTQNTTAGKINAFFTLNPALWKPYADAVN